MLNRFRILWARGSQVWSVLRLSRFDISTAGGRSKERYRRIAVTAIGAVAAKGIGIVTVLISVPLTVEYLGAERFGIWMTISSFAALLSFADLGMGGGLLNSIAQADGRDDRAAAQKAHSSTFFILVLSALLILTCLGITYSYLPWPDLFNATGELAARESGHATAIFIACFAVGLPLATVQRVQLGFQEGFQSSLWQAAGSLAGLIGILAVIFFEGGLPWLVLASSGAPLLVTLINWITEFGWRRPWLTPRLRHFHGAVSKRIVTAGSMFAILQLLSFLGSMSDNFIITHLFGASAVAGYAVVYKLFTVLFIVQFILTPLWPAFGEAMARGDIGATKIMFHRFSKLCTMMGIAIAVCFVITAQPLIGLWVGSELVPGMSLVVGFGAWIVVASLYAPVAALLSTESLLRYQLQIYSLAAVSSFVLKVTLGHLLGIPGIIWGTVIGYGLFLIYAIRIAREVLEPK